MFFPEYMTNQKRWLVRPVDDVSESKRPRSPLREQPKGYSPKVDQDGQLAEGKNTWRTRWNQQCICGTFEQANTFYQKRNTRYDGLSFVIHPFGRVEKCERLICLDFDEAFGPDGQPWPWLRAFLDCLDGFAFVEYSRSRTGLHVFLLTECEAFDKIKRKYIHETACILDGLCAAQVAVTGEVFENYSELHKINYSLVTGQHWWHHKAKSEAVSQLNYEKEWWQHAREDKPLDAEMVRVMQEWPRADKGKGRSDNTLAAACVLLSEGIVGWDAVEYLKHVRTDTPFDEDGLKHKVESAHVKTLERGNFDNKDANEFDVVEEQPKPPEVTLPEGTPGIMFEGAHFLTLAELDNYEVELSWLIKQVAIDCPTQTLCFGGREKTFKTSVMADFCVSVATGKPFLGKFEVVTTKKVLFLTAEIGLPSARSLLRRVREEKGVPRGVVDNLIVSTWLPNFNSKPDLKRLDKVLKHFTPDITLFDPFYFGASEAEVGNMYKMAGMLRPLTQLCTGNKSMPVIAHHANRSKAGQFTQMGLDELYGAGFQAYVRQWVLLSHAEAMTGGRATLWCTFGGSAFRTPTYKLYIDEGETDEEKVDTRKWSVRIEKPESLGVDAVSVREKVLSVLGDFELSLKEVAEFLPDVDKQSIRDTMLTLRDENVLTFQGGKYRKLSGEEFTNG